MIHMQQLLEYPEVLDKTKFINKDVEPNSYTNKEIISISHHKTLNSEIFRLTKVNITNEKLTILTVTIAIDANGNRITGFNFYYEYNNFNQLVRVRQNNSTGNIIEEYVYDESGNRIYKKMGNESTFYVNENLVRVINSSGSFDTIYYYDEKDLVARKDPNGQKFFYHPDHLGSTAIITNET